MKTLYVSQPDCYLSLQQENIIVKKGDTILAKIQIPLVYSGFKLQFTFPRKGIETLRSTDSEKTRFLCRSE